MMATTKKYAENTTVPVSKSRTEIEALFKRFGTRGFLIGEDEEADMALIGFAMKNRQYRIKLVYPKLEEFHVDPKTYSTRPAAQAQALRNREIQRRWRSLTMVIKAKLTAIDDGITTFAQAFRDETVMANNQTFGEWAEPKITEMYETGEMPDFLPGSNSQPKQIGTAKPSYIEGEITEGD